MLCAADGYFSGMLWKLMAHLSQIHLSTQTLKVLSFSYFWVSEFPPVETHNLLVGQMYTLNKKKLQHEKVSE